MIDLLGQTELRVTIAFDELNDSATFTFKTSADAVLGDLRIERGRVRSLAEFINIIAKTYYEDGSNFQGYKLSLNVNAGTATVDFG